MPTADFEKLGTFYLGRSYDLGRKKRSDELLLYDSKDLVTHGVCVGMTGSGKTGLCITILEEAAIDGIPAIVIDPTKSAEGDQTTDEASAVLKANEIVGIPIDQHIQDTNAVVVDFFNRPAATTSALAALALRTGAPLVPAFAQVPAEIQVYGRVNVSVFFEEYQAILPGAVSARDILASVLLRGATGVHTVHDVFAVTPFGFGIADPSAGGALVTSYYSGRELRSLFEFTIDADASKEEIEALVAQSQKRSAVYDIITNPTNVTVQVA